MRFLLVIFASTTILVNLKAISDIEANHLYFMNLGPRADGTVAERLALDHIAKKLDALDIAYTREALDSGDRGHSFSENIIARIPGSLSGQYVLAAPIDGGAFSIALLLEIANELTINRPKNTVTLLFLGAEKGDTRFHPYGSRLALEELAQKENTFALYLSSDEIPRTWDMEIGSNRVINPSWFVEELVNVLSSRNIPFSLKLIDILITRLGLKRDTNLPETWLDAGIPTISLTGSKLTESENRAGYTRRLLDTLLSLDYILEEIPSDWERTYLLISSISNTNSHIVYEGTYVVVFLAVSTALIVVILVSIRNIKLNVKRFARNWWTLPFLLTVVFLFLFLSTLLVEGTLLLSGFPKLWEQFSGAFIFFKLSLAAALSLVFILVTGGLPLIRNPHFYSYSAIGAALFTFLIFIAIDITVAVYLLWTIINLLIFTGTRSSKLKIVFLILSIIPYIAGLVLLEPYSNIIESLLLSRVSGNLVISLLLFPILLATTSLNYWNSRYFKRHKSTLIPVVTLVLSAAAICMLLWLINLNPYDRNNPQPVHLMDDIDLTNGERYIQVSSPGPIDLAGILVDEKIHKLRNSEGIKKIQIPLGKSSLDVAAGTRAFLGRRTIFVTVSGEENPRKFEIALQSDSPFTLHSANFPFEMRPSGTLASIFIGDYPPFPITLQFTVNDDASLRLIIDGFWVDVEDFQLINQPDLDITSTRRIHQESELK